MPDTTAPLFRQIATLIEDLIVDGTLKPGDRAPSINELAAFHRINPATARKGLGVLFDAHILFKRPGIGMFVTDDAPRLARERREAAFTASFLVPLVDESIKLGLTHSYVHALLDQVAESRGLYR
ncbi:hypothetical protein CDES_13410 [Corynebacterium deserti GIMN1.010]|uniref:HTH gntR-type domain-containing protein n=1 Tax=Corynebacterium deserti GIMN1.010 TaxID=931089 RepID=A0A0M4CZJ8_9CORY|nr:GntR family transcriptional regulator [Corynebacterium deserti]ALC07012.1 hypothetical protein CDES_13410 [Corynebacterium deserti GIMN1.010]